MENYNVVVVGAGLAGLQCARLLARQGLSVMLADRKGSLAERVHTTGIFVRRTLEDFDLPEDCLGPPVRRVTLYSPARRALRLESEHDEFRIGRMSRLYSRWLAECERLGVVWTPNVRYEGLESARRSEGAGAEFIVKFETAEGVRKVRTRYLVGADGAQSRVARDLELDENRAWIVGVEDVFHGAPFVGLPRFDCFLDPLLAPGYLAWVTHDGEETHVGVGGYAARFDPARALERFRASLEGMVDLRGAERCERRGGRIPVGGVLRRIANHRGLLVGDAAGAVSPLTAGGLDPCLRLSKFAAEVIGSYLRTGDEKILAAYAGERFRARFVTRLWLRRVMAQLRHPLLLEAACAALRFPLIRPLARHIFFGRGSFPDAALAPVAQPLVT